MECLWRIFRNNSAVGCYRQKFLLSLLIGAYRCLSFGFICHSVGICNQAFTLNDTCFPEINLGLLLHGLRNQVVDVSLTFFYVSSESYCQYLFVIAGGFSGNSVLKTDTYDIVLFQFLDFGRHGCLGQILH